MNLYQYFDSDDLQTHIESYINSNFNTEIIKEISGKLSLSFLPEKEPEGNVCFINSPEVRDDFKTTFASIDLLDYVYAVLHSTRYRVKDKKFLKIDLSGVPYPKDADTFWKLVKLGGKIRQIHLLESPAVENYVTEYPVDGNNVVTKPRFLNSPPEEKNFGRIYINNTQYFDNVPKTAWNFYIGRLQPAQKWLKNRKGRKLEYEDILLYQNIIVALSETDRLVKDIDKIEFD